MHKFIDIIVLKEYYTEDELKRIDDIIANYNSLAEIVTMLQGEVRRNNKDIFITGYKDTLFIIA